MPLLFENRISVVCFFFACDGKPHLKTAIPWYFGLVGKIMPICSFSILFENGISVFFFLLVMGTFGK